MLKVIRRQTLLAIVTLAGGLWGTPALAAVINLSATDTGAYTASGFHLSTNKSYTTGISGGTENRSYFVFDFSSLSGVQVMAAELQITNPPNGYNSPNTSETFQLFDVSTPISMLEATNFGAIGVFADLGTGTSYGTRTVSAVDNGTLVRTSLNGAALTGLGSALGGTWAVGGALTSLNGATNEFAFGFTGSGNPSAQLLLTATLPEPSTYSLVALALLSLSVAGWKQKQKNGN